MVFNLSKDSSNKCVASFTIKCTKRINADEHSLGKRNPSVFQTVVDSLGERDHHMAIDEVVPQRAEDDLNPQPDVVLVVGMRTGVLDVCNHVSH